MIVIVVIIVIVMMVVVCLPLAGALVPPRSDSLISRK